MSFLRLPSSWPDAAQRLAEQAFDGRSVELGVCTQLGEHGLHLTLAKAEVAQGGEDLGVCVDAAWVYWVPVSGAIRVAEDQSTVAVALDEQLAAMDGSVMASAKRQQIAGLVATAFCAWLNMMHVDERRMGAAWSAATPLVAREHGATQRWWDALLSAPTRTDIGACGSLLQVGVDGAPFGNGSFLSRARCVHVDVVWPLVGRGALVAVLRARGVHVDVV